MTSLPSTELGPPPGRLSVGVIGTGRVGSVLGAALGRVQHRIVAVAAVSDASRNRAETMLPGVPVLAPPDVCAKADLVLVAVPDDVLPGLVQGLADVGAWQSGQLVVHTSGRFGVAVLRPATLMGAVPLAVHPVMTFTGTSLDLDRLEGCVFGVTAPPAFVPIADALVLEVGGEPVHVPEEQRELYHAALAHAANHLVTLVTSSVDLLRDSGIDDPARLLHPLLTAALDNALRVGDSSLTGPVARADAGTLRQHIDVIGSASVETRDAYVALARLTALRALNSGLLSPIQAESLLDVLAVKSGDA
ncbi:MAG: DUF2520 domain-containing protein [Candidatus Nanopelagicales bacterium]